MKIGFRFGSRAFAVVAIGLVLVVAVGSSAELRPTPPWAGPGFPEPPMQREPWSPPKTGLPKFLVAATATLADQGLADPRGCEYREVEFEGEGQGGFLNGGHPRPVTHAWVLPARPEGGPRFAVAWNGLVYPLVKLGDPVSLEADVPPLPGADEPNERRVNFAGANYDTSHFDSASQVGRYPIRACVLLRLGRADLAERAFAAATVWNPPGSPRDLTSYGVSYLTLAADWTWALCDRAVAAHPRRADREALTDSRELARIKPLIEAKARAMGFLEGQVDGSSFNDLRFLKPIPALLADQEIRARRTDRRPPDLTQVAKIAERPERIAALIDALSETPPIDRMFGRFNQENTALKAIIQEGPAAVDALLKSFESDDRLTRDTNSDHRRFGTRVRTITPVFQLAYQGLVEILGTSQFAPGSIGYVDVNLDTPKRRELAASIRTYVERFRDVPEPEKSYQILADDQSSPGQWVEVAARIVASAVPEVLIHPRQNLIYRQPKVRYVEKVPRQGDSLRGKKSPSVSELLSRRIDTLVQQDGSFEAMGLAKSLALDLALWDPEAARPVMADVARRCLDRVLGKIPERFGQQIATEAAILAQLVDVRLQIGDPKGLADYAEMLMRVDPRTFPHSIETVVQPMEDYPEEPAIIAVAEKIFLDPNSPWLPFLGDDQHPNAWSHNESLIGSPLLGVAAFRTMLIRTLGDRSPFGTTSLDDQGTLNYQLRRGGGGSGGGGLTYIDSSGPKATPDVPMRACDYLAWKLSAALNGIPPLMPTWSEERRNRVIADQVSFLQRYGPRFAISPLRDAIPNRFFGIRRREPVFPPLDQPATAEDIRQGRAIFTLEGRGPTRVVKLADRPIVARWVTLKDYADPQQVTVSGSDKTTIEVAYNQDGLVWQAEEVEEGGHWRRYYGFAGRRLDRVPAEEIEFSEPWNSTSLMSQKVDALLFANQEFPRTFVLRLRNRAGLPRAVPTTYVTLNPPAVRPGVELLLSYTPTYLEQGNRQRTDATQPEWEPSKIRPVGLVLDASTKNLEPAESFEACTMRVEDWFDLSRPGTYRLMIRFGVESGIGEGASNELFFLIPELAQPAR